MPTPTTIFAFILATLIGASFHLVVGGDARRLAFFLLAGWVGFALGHFSASMLEINILNIGTLHLVPSMVGALTALIVTRLLSQPKHA